MKPIKLINDSLDQDDLNALGDWVKDSKNQLTKGPLTKELEENFAKLIGTTYSIFVNSGSSAILLALAALKEVNGLKNNKIVVPALSWATDFSSPVNLGLKPILCDCNLSDLSVDLTHLEDIFQSERPACLLLVSVLGLVPDMDAIKRLCRKYEVILLEDCCESLASKYNGQNLGTFGTLSMFSTYYGHHLSTIEGGFICTDDRILYNTIMMLRSHGWTRDCDEDFKKEKKEDWNIEEFEDLYTFYVPGYNLRATDIQAFLGLRQLKKIEEVSRKRFENFKKMKSVFKYGFPLSIRETDFISNFAFPLFSYDRKDLVKRLRENNIECRPLIAGSMGNQPIYKRKFRNDLRLRNADLIHRNACYIPNHSDLTDDDISRMAKVINEAT